MKAPKPWPPPPPPHLKVVFLDFDGVLNYKGYPRSAQERKRPLSTEWWAEALHPDLIALVNGLLERTGAKVVVSSSWRIDTNRQWLQRVLEARGFKGEVIGITPRHTGCDRCEEIAAWLQGRPVKAFVILDDDADADIPGHFIQTDFETGLTPEGVEKAELTLMT